jgi:hypothetical protein
LSFLCEYTASDAEDWSASSGAIVSNCESDDDTAEDTSEKQRSLPVCFPLDGQAVGKAKTKHAYAKQCLDPKRKRVLAGTDVRVLALTETSAQVEIRYLSPQQARSSKRQKCGAEDELQEEHTNEKKRVPAVNKVEQDEKEKNIAEKKAKRDEKMRDVAEKKAEQADERKRAAAEKEAKLDERKRAAAQKKAEQAEKEEVKRDQRKRAIEQEEAKRAEKKRAAAEKKAEKAEKEEAKRDEKKRVAKESENEVAKKKTKRDDKAQRLAAEKMAEEERIENEKQEKDRAERVRQALANYEAAQQAKRDAEIAKNLQTRHVNQADNQLPVDLNSDANYDANCYIVSYAVANIASEQVVMVLTGEGGTGKSDVIHAIKLQTQMIVGKVAGYRGACVNMAPTGAAAFNIQGNTWQKCLEKKRQPYSGPKSISSYVQSILENAFLGARVIVIDEFSLLSFETLVEISER